MKRPSWQMILVVALILFVLGGLLLPALSVSRLTGRQRIIEHLDAEPVMASAPMALRPEQEEAKAADRLFAESADVPAGSALLAPNEADGDASASATAPATKPTAQPGRKLNEVRQYGGITASVSPETAIDTQPQSPAVVANEISRAAFADRAQADDTEHLQQGSGEVSLGGFVSRAGKAQRRAAQPAPPALPNLPALPLVELAQQLAQVPPAPFVAGDPAQRLIDLSVTYRLPGEVPSAIWARLPGGGPLPIGSGLTAGQHLLYVARQRGCQVLPVAGRLVWRQRPAELDPTATHGLGTAAFTEAWGTPPMAVVARDPQHTFALDDGTSSFRRAQADLHQGRLPDPASIRVEHFINAVPDDYPRPQHAAFALYAEAGPHPFSQRSTLVAVGVAGRDARPDERRPLRLVLGLDVSGSMAQRGGWERARHALGGLIDHLRADDRVAVVAFAERARVVLPVVPGSAQDAIQAALDRLDPQGSTNLAEGLALSCQVARELAEPGCALRVALVSDGVALAGADAATANAWLGGLTAVGGNLLLLTVGEQVADLAAHEALATAGDGTLLHLTSDDDDDLRDRLLPERLQLVAQDAKAQVTWNPDRVSHARLVGYEHRRLAHRDFRNDAVAAGAIAAAVTVTALFEVVLVEGGHGPLGTAAVRYHDVRLGQVREQACPLPGTILSRAASPRLRTLACAAELAEQLRGGWWANVRPTPFADISAACRGLPQPADALAGMADTAARLVNVPRIAP